MAIKTVMNNAQQLNRTPRNMTLTVIGLLVIIFLQLWSAFVNWQHPDADAINSHGLNLILNFLVPVMLIAYLRYRGGSWLNALSNPAGLPQRDERERAIAHQVTAVTMGVAVILLLFVGSLSFFCRCLPAGRGLPICCWHSTSSLSTSTSCWPGK